MVPEAPLETTDSGLVPKGEGWFVVNAKEARWFEHEKFGSGTVFEGEERPLQAWDFVHCPPGTNHVFVGAGVEPCGIVSIGRRFERKDEEIVYPVDEVALKHDAGVEEETPDPKTAYAPYGTSAEAPYRGQLDR